MSSIKLLKYIKAHNLQGLRKLKGYLKKWDGNGSPKNTTPGRTVLSQDAHLGTLINYYCMPLKNYHILIPTWSDETAFQNLPTSADLWHLRQCAVLNDP
jgi:hypothetical protein